MRKWLAALAFAPVVLAGCSEVGDLPDSGSFRTCLTDAGADPDDLDSADARADAFADPATLDCVTALSADEQHDVLADVFTTDELLEALGAWVRHTETRSEDAARIAGTLAGAGGDPEDFRVTDGLLDQYLAVEIRHQDGITPFYGAWSADPDEQRSVPGADPTSGATLYVNWLEDHAEESRAYAEGDAILALADQVATAREAATEE